MDISCDSGSIGGLDGEVSIDLARYKMGHDDVPVLDSFRQVVNNQLNSGHSRFTAIQRALCHLRTEHNSVVTSVVIHCSFLSASFKLCILCRKKKVFCFGNHNETDCKMESSKVPGNKESVYDKVVKEFRELEKKADKSRKTRKDFG